MIDAMPAQRRSASIPLRCGLLDKVDDGLSDLEVCARGVGQTCSLRSGLWLASECNQAYHDLKYPFRISGIENTMAAAERGGGGRAGQECSQRALDLLETLGRAGQVLSLADIAQQTGLAAPTAPPIIAHHAGAGLRQSGSLA